MLLVTPIKWFADQLSCVKTATVVVWVVKYGITVLLECTGRSVSRAAQFSRDEKGRVAALLRE